MEEHLSDIPIGKNFFNNTQNVQTIKEKAENFGCTKLYNFYMTKCTKNKVKRQITQQMEIFFHTYN